MVGYIISMIAFFLFGGCLGALIVANKTLKELQELDNDLKDITESYEKESELADKCISSYRRLNEGRKKLIELYGQVVSHTYTELVAARDNGSEGLDEIIGFLGQILDDGKEDKCECQDHENHSECTDECKCHANEQEVADEQ